MKRKLLALAMAVALGVSVFGGSAQAAATQEASVHSGCSHSTLRLVSKEFDHYEQASSEFHRKYYNLIYECTNYYCSYTLPGITYEIEDHIFCGISANNKWLCPCGEEDDYP